MLLAGAHRGAGEAAPYKRAPTRLRTQQDVPAETPSMAQRQGRRTGAHRRDRAPPRDRSRHSRRALPGRRPCRCGRPGRRRRAWPVRPWKGGTRVSAETSQRLACDARRVVMSHDADGRTIEVGARTRTVPPALRLALLHRDQGCRFPGCGLPFVQAHHIHHWAHGGPTTLSNLVMLCRFHHRAVHEEGYQVDRDADGELRFRRPDGRVIPDVPSPAEPA